MARTNDPARQKTVAVYWTNDEMEARMVQELLRNNGIESVVTSESAPGLFPVSMGNLARQEILVLESEAEKAAQIIAAIQEGGEAADEGDAEEDE